jgi:flavin-dependent dehydrogenase
MQPIAETDLVIVGGGPAGAAAAIAARSCALRVVVLERDVAPRIRPGEAAHPGIEPLLKRLGVMDAVQTADFLRYEGHWVAWGREPLRFVPFGQDERGPWKGFQLWRPDFDAILLDGAGRAGALIVRPCGELHPIVRGNRIAGVKTKAGTWRCAFVIDATGRQRWLARAFNLQTERHGPPRVAWFGYAQGHRPELDPNPMIASDASGWTWMARIRPSLYQWVRLPLHGPRPPNDWSPVEFSGLQPMQRRRGIDVSWTIANLTAGPGYFLTGDAASVVDPLSSHGLLKAVMSGMKAAHHSAAVLRRGVSPEAAANAYHDWLIRWFRHDRSGLGDLYSAIGGIPGHDLLQN